METFEELQQLWQAQPAPAASAAEDLLRQLRQHNRKHLRVFAVKTAAVAILAACMVAAVRQSALALAGVLLVIAGAAVALAVDWTTHLAITRLAFDSAATDFAQAALHRLRRLRSPQRLQLAAFILGPVAGLNLMELALLHSLGSGLRIAVHLVLSLLALAAGWAGFRVRRRRFERETRPLIARLKVLESPNWGH